VSADDGGASGIGIDPTGLRRETGAAVFATTHWSVVLEAQGESPAAQDALEKLCRTYWRPVYSFIRRQGVGIEEAEDFTQGFFALLLERRDLDAVRREKGRLRSYLLTSIKHFLASEQRRAMAVKRGKGQRLVPLDGLIDAALGRKEDALREGRRALELTPPEKDSLDAADVLYYFAVICAWVGERDLAIEQLQASAKLPAGVSYAEICLDPHWDPLRADPRFEKIVAALAPR
jgi:DNA-directed RNA polymerase specialized sigma24 family protein